MEACFALSWLANDAQMKDIAKKIHDNTKTDKQGNLMRTCYLETLIHRPVPEATAGLIDMMSPSQPDMEVRNQVARAIGMGGITRNMVDPIFQKLNDVALKADAALSLMLGADADTASRAIATYNDPSQPAEAIEELKDIYNKTFGYWSDRNYDTGDIARWVENAEAISHVKVRDQLQDWPRIILGRNLVESVEIDNGPHSMTRVVLRNKLARTIVVRLPMGLEDRLPMWKADQNAVACKLNGKSVVPARSEHSLLFDVRPGDVVVLTFPVPTRTDRYTIDGKVYNVEFRGSTVVDVEPRETGTASIPIYQRQSLKATTAPRHKVRRFIANRILPPPMSTE